jgi:2-hydroxy-3-oxopropionate reductase
MSNIGFIGLGIMGRPMAANLIKSGEVLSVYNRSCEATDALSLLGAIPCRNAREVAERSEIVILMLPDTPDVEQVLFGNDGVASGIKAGAIVIDMSSISPMATRKFAKALEDQGVEMLDALVQPWKDWPTCLSVRSNLRARFSPPWFRTCNGCIGVRADTTSEKPLSP